MSANFTETSLQKFELNFEMPPTGGTPIHPWRELRIENGLLTTVAAWARVREPDRIKTLLMDKVLESDIIAAKNVLNDELSAKNVLIDNTHENVDLTSVLSLRPN